MWHTLRVQLGSLQDYTMVVVVVQDFVSTHQGSNVASVASPERVKQPRT